MSQCHAMPCIERTYLGRNIDNAAVVGIVISVNVLKVARSDF